MIQYAASPGSPPSRSLVLGRVHATRSAPATQDQFSFWVAESARVEKGQLVVVDASGDHPGSVRVYGTIEQVDELTEDADTHADVRRCVGDPSTRPAIEPHASRCAHVRVLRTVPGVQVPPRMGSPVRLAGPADAEVAYGFDQVPADRRVAVGVLRNGHALTAGPAYLHLDYLLGESGAHMNVGGISGVATKTSALLTTVYMLKHHEQMLQRECPGAEPLSVIPVLFNVKGGDLLWIDRPSRRFHASPEYAERWREMGVQQPGPFKNVAFLAPATASNPHIAQQVVHRTDLLPYSWALSDVVRGGLLPLLFDGKDLATPTFRHILFVFEELLTARSEHGTRSLQQGTWTLSSGKVEPVPQTFSAWLAFLSAEIEGIQRSQRETSKALGQSHISTLQSLYRRLSRLQHECLGVIAWDSRKGCPPRIIPSEHDVYTIDLASLGRSKLMQTFVVGAVLQQLLEERTSRSAAPGIRYLVGLDELNEWAPRGSQDEVAQLFERISGQMRSLGIILLGAQQLASQVSRSVIENAGCKLIGRTGAGELREPTWSWLSPSQRSTVESLGPGEQLMMLPTFQAPAHVLLPHPAWATRASDALPPPRPERRARAYTASSLDCPMP